MKKTIADSISEKIKRGEITMRSQFSVWVEKWGLNGGMVILFVLLSSIAGFVFYWINSNSDLLFGGYGRFGLASFFQSFPYLFVISFITLFAILILVFRTFDFSYRRPFFFIILSVAIGALVVGWISIKQPMSQHIYQNEGKFLRMGMMNNRNAVTGIVIEVNNNRIVIQNYDNKIIFINIKATTHFPFGHPKEGDQIRSVGSWEGDTFTAIGVRIFDEKNPSTLGPGMMKGRGQGQGRGMMWNR